MDREGFEAIRTLVRDFVRSRVVPLENEIDDKDGVPDDIRAACRDMGLFGFAIPAEFGGLGLSMEEESRLVFELGYTTPAHPVHGSQHGNVSPTSSSSHCQIARPVFAIAI